MVSVLTKEGVQDGGVLGEGVGTEMKALEKCMRNQHPQDHRGKDGAKDLAHNVSSSLDGAGHASSHHTEGDSGIDMASRVVADHVNGDRDAEAEGESNDEGVEHDICTGQRWS